MTARRRLTPTIPAAPHQPGNPLLADGWTFGTQLGMNSRCTIGAARDSMDRAHSSEQRIIGDGARRRQARPPSVVTGSRHAEHACHGGEGEEGLVRTHELEEPDGITAVSVRTRPLPLPRYRAPGAVAGSHAADGSAPRVRRWPGHPVGGLHRDQPDEPGSRSPGQTVSRFDIGDLLGFLNFSPHLAAACLAVHDLRLSLTSENARFSPGSICLLLDTIIIRSVNGGCAKDTFPLGPGWQRCGFVRSGCRLRARRWTWMTCCWFLATYLRNR